MAASRGRLLSVVVPPRARRVVRSHRREAAKAPDAGTEVPASSLAFDAVLGCPLLSRASCRASTARAAQAQRHPVVPFRDRIQSACARVQKLRAAEMTRRELGPRVQSEHVLQPRLGSAEEFANVCHGHGLLFLRKRLQPRHVRQPRVECTG